MIEVVYGTVVYSILKKVKSDGTCFKVGLVRFSFIFVAENILLMLFKLKRLQRFYLNITMLKRIRSW